MLGSLHRFRIMGNPCLWYSSKMESLRSLTDLFWCLWFFRVSLRISCGTWPSSRTLACSWRSSSSAVLQTGHPRAKLSSRYEQNKLIIIITQNNTSQTTLWWLAFVYSRFYVIQNATLPFAVNYGNGQNILLASATRMWCFDISSSHDGMKVKCFWVMCIDLLAR